MLLSRPPGEKVETVTTKERYERNGVVSARGELVVADATPEGYGGDRRQPDGMMSLSCRSDSMPVCITGHGANGEH